MPPERKQIKADRAEAESDLAEAMRITNSAIRRVHKLGLSVEASILTLHSPGGPVPQVNFGTIRSLINDDPSP